MKGGSTSLALLCAIAGACFGLLTAFPTGAPYKACANLYPKHPGSSGNIQAQLTPSPFTITFNPSNYNPGDEVNVTLKDPTGQRKFKGFQLKARRTTGDKEELVGSFINLPVGARGQAWYPQQEDYMNCVTHSGSEEKDEVTIPWKAHNISLGNVVFRATFVEKLDTFWVDVESSELVGAIANPEANVGWVTNSTFFDELVTDKRCQTTKGCMLFPSFCSGLNCNYIVTYELLNDGMMTFEIKAKADGYVTLGLSADTKMGKDETVTCVNKGGYVSVQYGYNPGYYNDRHSIKGFRNIQTINRDGYIYCRFSRPTTRNVTHIQESNGAVIKEEVTFDLVNEPWYIFLAYGGLYQGADVLGKHKEYPLISNSKVYLTEKSIVRAGSLPIMTKVHATLMIIAWKLFAYVAITLGYNFQDIFKGKRVNWFEAHRLLAILTALFTIVSAILIFVKVNGWSKNGGSHSYVGTTVMALVVIQIIMGALRPDKDSPQRIAFKVLHAFVAFALQALADAAIIIATQLPLLHDQLRLWLLITFIVSICINFLWSVSFGIINAIRINIQQKIDTYENGVGQDNPSMNRHTSDKSPNMMKTRMAFDENQEENRERFDRLGRNLKISLVFYVFSLFILTVVAILFIFLF